MNVAELLSGIAAREEQGLPTSRVILSPKDAKDLRRSVVGSLPLKARLRAALRLPHKPPKGPFGEVFSVAIWVDPEAKEATFV